MSAVQKLFEEHRLIEAVLAAMETFVGTFREDSEAGRAEVVRFVTFFREYADLLHHEKEEAILMPALAEAGMRWDEGLLPKLREEHDFERHLLQTLRHLGLQSGDWSQEDGRRFQELSQRFVQFMRRHIELEDCELPDVVMTRLSSEERARLSLQLDQFDEKHAGLGEVDWLVSLGRELETRYAAPK